MGEEIEQEGLSWSRSAGIKKAILSYARPLILLGLLAVVLVAAVLSYRKFFKPKPVLLAPVVHQIKAEPTLQEQAREAFNKGLSEQSLSLYRQSFEKDPHNIVVQNDMAYVLWKLGRLKEADKVYSQLAENVSNCAECFNNWGQVKQALGQLAEAENIFKRAILADAKYPDPYFNLAVLYEQNGDFASAEKSYEDYLQKQPQKIKIIESIKRRIEKLDEAY